MIIGKSMHVTDKYCPVCNEVTKIYSGEAPGTLFVVRDGEIHPVIVVLVHGPLEFGDVPLDDLTSRQGVHFIAITDNTFVDSFLNGLSPVELVSACLSILHNELADGQVEDSLLVVDKIEFFDTEEEMDAAIERDSRRGHYDFLKN